jgi:hypothetical protein
MIKNNKMAPFSLHFIYTTMENMNLTFNINNDGGSVPVSIFEALELVDENLFLIFTPKIRGAKSKARQLRAAQYLKKIYLLHIWSPLNPN